MDLTKGQKEKIDEISKKHDLKMMVVFGSQISGKTHTGSDLDIGILLKQDPKSYHILLDVQSELREVFAGYKLDVSYLHNVTPYFLFEAVYKGELLYGSNREFVKLCAKAFKQYIDTKPLRDLRDEIIEKKQKELLSYA
jgi:uncharacterized protein